MNTWPVALSPYSVTPKVGNPTRANLYLSTISAKLHQLQTLRLDYHSQSNDNYLGSYQLLCLKPIEHLHTLRTHLRDFVEKRKNKFVISSPTDLLTQLIKVLTFDVRRFLYRSTEAQE